MRFEILIQFIVPLTFLAIWALTTLLNREAQPLPPRPGRPAGPRPGGFAPGSSERRLPSAEPLGRTPQAPGAPEPNFNWTTGRPLVEPARPRAGERPAPALSDAIVFLETEPPRTAPAVGARGSASPGVRPSQRPQQGRRSGRGRTPEPAQGPAARSPSPSHRALSGQMQESLALRRARPLEITPLSKPIKRLARPLTQASEAAQVAQDRGGAEPASLSAAEVRLHLSSPERIREALILSEILAPPLALRRRRS